MDVSLEIKEEICKTQNDLKDALRYRESLHSRLKRDENNKSIKQKIKDAENNIITIGRVQKTVLERLKLELSMYQDKMRACNKIVNIENDNRKIAFQLRSHLLRFNSRKRSLLKSSVTNATSSCHNVDDDLKGKGESNGSDDRFNFNDRTNYKNGSRNANRDSLDDDSKFIEATENFSLKDTPLIRNKMQERKANLANTLSKVKKSLCPSVEITAKIIPSPKSESSKSSSPSPPRSVLSPTPSPPISITMPLPGDPITQETFLRFLHLMTPQQRAILEKKRSERKKRSTTSTNKNEFVYGNFEMSSKKKKNNFPYLQQNIGPPQTRSQKMRKQLAERHPTSTNSPTESPSASPPPSWPSSLRIPSGLTIQPVRSPGPKLCISCGQNDGYGVLIQCGKCKNYFHSRCGSRSSSRSPSRSRSPLNGSSDRRTKTVCPDCGEEFKENKTSNWTVIPRYFSQNGNLTEHYRERLREKRMLQERNKVLNAEVRKLEAHLEVLKENIETSNVEKKQLISNQNNTRKHIKTLLDFVNKFKDTSVSLYHSPLNSDNAANSSNGTKKLESDNEDLSNGY